MDEKEYLFSVEGNLGSGKNTFMNMMHRYLKSDQICIKKEPLYKWNSQRNDMCSHNLLDMFYNDTERWSFTTQIRCTTMRIKECEKIRRPIGFCERTWYSDHNVFAPSLHSLGYMNDIEYETFNSNFNLIVKNAPQISGIIYVRSPVNSCMKRLISRNKFSCATMSMNYLQTLNDNYEKWLYCDHFEKIPICIVDLDSDSFDHDECMQDAAFRTVIKKFPILRKYLNEHSIKEFN